jgi:hypothetical protein
MQLVIKSGLQPRVGYNGPKGQLMNKILDPKIFQKPNEKFETFRPYLL